MKCNGLIKYLASVSLSTDMKLLALYSFFVEVVLGYPY